MNDVEQSSKADEVFSSFDGFSEPNEKNYFPMPQEWAIISTFIDNLAEYKVVEYILRRTWGYHEHEEEKEITTEQFMHGRKRKDGSQIDYGTGLSKQSVITGLKKAEKHHLIRCTVDDSDKARVKKYYSLNLYKSDVKDLDTDVNDLDITQAQGVQDLDSDQSNKLLEETLIEETVLRKGNIRCIHPSKNNLVGESHLAPIFLQRIVADLSRDFGDHEHIPSNITRAHKLYKVSNADPDTFLGIIYEARNKTRLASVKKINNQGRPNRMPYFFKCLDQLAKQPIAMEG